MIKIIFIIIINKYYVYRERGVWWNRQILNPEYIAPMDKNNQVLLDTLKSHKILLSNRTPLPVNPIFKSKFCFNYIFYNYFNPDGVLQFLVLT